MLARLTIKNYRRFTDAAPARIDIDRGITAFLGANDAGKSSILRLLYDFRELFGALSQPRDLGGHLGNPGSLAPFPFPPSIYDHSEVFSRENTRDMEFMFEFPTITVNSLTAITITFPRKSPAAYHLSFSVDGILQPPMAHLAFAAQVLELPDGRRVDWEPAFQLFRVLARTFYLGPARNVITINAQQDYYDIQIGTGLVNRWREMKTGAPSRSEMRRNGSSPTSSASSASTSSILTPLPMAKPFSSLSMVILTNTRRREAASPSSLSP